MWTLLCPAVHERTEPDNNGIRDSSERGVSISFSVMEVKIIDQAFVLFKELEMLPKRENET